MDILKKNHFELLGLPERFAIDEGELQAAYRRFQGAVHPDRFAAAGATERRIAMELATRANEAYRTLADPGRRAAYLCERHGAPIRAETNTAMAPAFLVEQMEWREALEDARAGRDREALEGLSRLLCDHRGRLLDELGAAIDLDRDWPRAADAVRRWMFVDKFGAEVASAEDALAA
ncbi:MAG TPA: Fe-S protein assembly co-chaperone HscB [Burkholderiaceae bacterium]|nr:Fe-S protein assembly co-chaperone HscB [Burkholderiaceae bacterium]